MTDYGGSACVTVTLPNATVEQVLAAPPSGDLYSLHSATWVLSVNNTVVLTGPSASPNYYASSGPGSIATVELYGQVVPGVLDAEQYSGSSGSVTVCYDQVVDPTTAVTGSSGGVLFDGFGFIGIGLILGCALSIVKSIWGR